jgi:hypothetical protein
VGTSGPRIRIFKWRPWATPPEVFSPEKWSNFRPWRLKINKLLRLFLFEGVAVSCYSIPPPLISAAYSSHSIPHPTQFGKKSGTTAYPFLSHHHNFLLITNKEKKNNQKLFKKLTHNPTHFFRCFSPTSTTGSPPSLPLKKGRKTK